MGHPIQQIMPDLEIRGAATSTDTAMRTGVGSMAALTRKNVALEHSDWKIVDNEPLLETTVGGLLRTLAAEVPDRIAFVEGVPEAGERRRWTYRELLESGERVARALLLHFRPGERIAVWSPNSAEWVLLQHGASLAGLVLVTVNPAYLAGELAHVLRTSRAAGIFYIDEYRGHRMAESLKSIRDQLAELRVDIAFSAWESFVESSDPSLELPDVQPLDMVQIQFTSGTTGKPKGACLHHLGIINAARFASRRAGFPDGGVWVSAMPLFHVGGCAGSELGAFTARGTFVMQPAFDAEVMLDLLESEGAHHLHAVPTMVTALLEHPSRPGRNLRNFRTVMSGGSKVPTSLVLKTSQELGCKFTISFGQTELNGVICQTYPDDAPEEQSQTIGQPAPQMEVRIVDPATGAIQPLGVPGEIWARGYQAMHGYFNIPADSDPTLTQDDWLRTGDQATMDAQGYLRVTGRLKDCIIRGGENIYPAEVEEILCAHPAVRQASVVGVADSHWGEVVAAVIRIRDGETAPSTLELHGHCRARLAAYKTPAQWFYVTDYPTTTSGKIQKYLLRQMIHDGLLQPEAFTKPAR